MTPQTVTRHLETVEDLEGARKADLAQVTKLEVVDGAALYARTHVPRLFVVDGLIKQGDLALLAGRPKSGKSFLLLQLAQAIDSGTAFLGRGTTYQAVLYLALEDGERRIHERLHARTWTPSRTGFAFGLLPLGDGGMGQIEATIDGFDVIVIDTLRAACGADADENDNAKMGGIVQRLADVAHRMTKTIVVSHHTRKGEAEDAFELIRGAGAIRAAYDLGILLQRKTGESEATLKIESRDIEAEDMTIRFEGATGWSYEGNGARIEDIRAGRRVVAALREMGDDKTVEEIAENLKVSANAAGQQLRAAEKDGKVARQPSSDSGGRKPRDLWRLA